MNIEEAIKHAEEMANTGDCDCANEHGQLAAWLRELMILRKVADAAREAEAVLNTKFLNSPEYLNMRWGDSIPIPEPLCSLRKALQALEKGEG